MIWFLANRDSIFGFNNDQIILMGISIPSHPSPSEKCISPTMNPTSNLPGMKIQPKPMANSAALSNQLKNNSTILSPLTQHLQAALKQHQAIQQQQVTLYPTHWVFLQLFYLIYSWVRWQRSTCLVGSCLAHQWIIIDIGWSCIINCQTLSFM